MRKNNKLKITHNTSYLKLSTAVWDSFFMESAKTTEDFMQDRADYLHAIAVLESQELRTSIADVRAELGLSD